jgi:predicted membrane channel-forming protein YqfA (hemolysin III family)
MAKVKNRTLTKPMHKLHIRIFAALVASGMLFLVGSRVYATNICTNPPDIWIPGIGFHAVVALS